MRHHYRDALRIEGIATPVPDIATLKFLFYFLLLGNLASGKVIIVSDFAYGGVAISYTQRAKPGLTCLMRHVTKEAA